MASTFTVIAHQEETVDALCWRILGRTEGVVEQVYELNRGLAAQGPLLTEGQAILMPIVTAPVTPERDIVKLWD